MTWPSCRANNRLHSVPVPVPVRLLSTNKTWQNARLWHHIVSAYFLYWLTVRELNKRDLALLFPRSVSLFNEELSLPPHCLVWYTQHQTNSNSQCLSIRDSSDGVKSSMAVHSREYSTTPRLRNPVNRNHLGICLSSSLENRN